MASAAVSCSCSSSRSQWLIGLVINLWLAGYFVSDGHSLKSRELSPTANLQNAEKDKATVTFPSPEQQQQLQLPALGSKTIPSEASSGGLKHSMDQGKDSSTVNDRGSLPLIGYHPQTAPGLGDHFGQRNRPSLQTLSDVCQRIPLCNRMLINLSGNTRARAQNGGIERQDPAVATPPRMPMTPQTRLHGGHASLLGRITGLETAQIGRKPVSQFTNPGGQLEAINQSLSHSLIHTLLKQIGQFLHKQAGGNGFWKDPEQLSPDEKKHQTRTKRQTSAGGRHNGTVGDNFIAGNAAAVAAIGPQTTTDSGEADQQNKTLDSHGKYANISDGGLSYRSMVGLVDSPGVVENPWGRGARERSSAGVDIPVDEPDEPVAHAEPPAPGQLLDAYVNESTEAPTSLHHNHVTTEETGLSESTNGMAQTPEAALTPEETDEAIPPEPEPEAETTLSLPIPEAEPEPEPEPEPEWSPEGEAEWTSEAEPEAEMEDADTGGCNPCLAEPEPDWESAKMQWEVAWEIHIYGVGILFAILAAYSFLSILRLFRKKNLLSQGYFIALNSLLLAMGLCRAVFFLVDGYNTNQVFHPVAAYFLYSIGFPCLTSAFSILFLALLQTLQMQVLSPRIQKTHVLVAVITLHFALSIVTDVTMGYVSDSKLLLLVCQIVFVLWGLFLFCGYIYIFKNLHQSAVRRQKSMLKLMMTKSDSNLSTSGLKRTIQMRFPLNVAIVVTMVTALFGLACAGLQIYAMVGVYSIFATKTPDAWPWWGFMLGLRVTELCMCATMSFVATQPFRYRVHHDAPSGRDCWTLISVMPCCRLCDTTQVEDEKVEWNNFGHVFQELGNGSTTSRDRTVSVRYSETTEETSALHHCSTPNGDPRFAHGENQNLSTTSAPKLSKRKPRPRSMLVYENGFIRFRHEEDPEGEPVASTDDELDSVDLSGRSRELNGAVQWASGYPTAAAAARPMLHSAACRKQSSGMTTPATPATPRSFASTDLDGLSDVFSFKAPSSIHLRESIERALDDTACPRFSLRTPDFLDYAADLDTYYSVPNTPDSVLDASHGFESLGDISSRGSFRAKDHVRNSQSAHDLKSRSQWIHKSPIKHYWNKVKTRGSSRSLNQALSSRYTHLDDTDGMLLRRKLKGFHRYRSKSDSLTDIPFYTDDI